MKKMLAQSYFKTSAILLMISLIAELAMPLTVLALTGGPTQPEFTDFEPVATTNLVNEFSGSFTYNLPVINIPGANGGGYAMSLAYHSGLSPSSEASWVGYGWTLNPGAIMRNTRGFPDDYKTETNEEVKYYNKTRKNWTISMGLAAGFEAFSADLFGESSRIDFDVNLSAHYSLRVNSHKGFGYVAGFGLNVAGIANYGYNVSDGEGTHSFALTPGKFLNRLYSELAHGKSDKAVKEEILNYTMLSSEERAAYDNKQLESMPGRMWLGGGVSSAAGQIDRAVNFVMNNNATSPRAFTPSSLGGLAFNFSSGFQVTNPPPFQGFQPLLTANYNQRTAPDKATPRKVLGYMYSGEAYSGAAENTVMDYYLEKSEPYTLRDKFMAIPFSNADNFGLTGEGLTGGFRLHHSKSGHFRPALSANDQMVIVNLGAEGGGVGRSGETKSFSVGADLGVGFQNDETRQWLGPIAANDRHKFKSMPEASRCERVDEPYFFRFNNDLGGRVEFDSDDKAIILDGSQHLPHSARHVMNDGLRSGRSSYIGYRTNEELLSGIGGHSVLSSTANVHARQMAPEGIGEFCIYTENNARYVYGLPVYNANDQSLQYITNVLNQNPQIERDENLRLATISNGMSIKTPDDGAAFPDDETLVVGEIRPKPYASMFLLSEITNPDYHDLRNDGPSDDDLGGWVKFSYNALHGTTANIGADWYKWRTPYSGLHYGIGEVSEPDDDVGAVSAGFKQVMYLEEIETKTHIAKFITSERLDGLSASASENAALATTSATGTQRLHKLDAIELYAKGLDGNNELLRTVHFEYDYHLMPGIPNSDGGPGSDGRLTLRSVWIEYEGIINTRITPYQFGYEYRSSADYNSILSADLQALHSEVISYGDQFVPTGSYNEQNPRYSPAHADAWGFYQRNGKQQSRRVRSWPDQNTPAGFDPAAWHLKWVRLPSGGEIHVQYEQHDYHFVQDRRAHVMVSLDNSFNAETDDNLTKFYLDVNGSLGSALSNEELETIADAIESQYILGGDEMYFKILYDFGGPEDAFDLAPIPQPHSAELEAEYVTGYAKVKNVGVDNAKSRLWVQLEKAPREACLDMVETSKAGRGELETMRELLEVDGLGHLAAFAYFEAQFLGSFLSDIATFGLFNDINRCRRFSYDNSYLRIPTTILAKKGGGVRVKRLLMLDSGLDDVAGRGKLLGSEYVYERSDPDFNTTISSGVATTEPNGMREENVLVSSYKRRNDQTFYERLTAGKDKVQFEGPFGESLLPAPSVAYSRVIVKNIYDKSNGAGFVVHEFATVQEFPFDMKYEQLGVDGAAWTDPEWENESEILPFILFQKTSEEIVGRQGYTFIINNMHGQPKRIASYGGVYELPETWVKSAEQEFSYFKPGEPVPMFYGLDRPFRYEQPGKEMEVFFDSRHNEETINDFAVEIDVTIFISPPPTPPFFVPTFFPSWRQSFHDSRFHVSSKVVRYPSIVKSVKSFKDDIYQTSENVAFDPATGQPVIRRTTDGFDGLTIKNEEHNGVYHSYTIPAHLHYREMGQMAANARKVLYTDDGDADTKIVASLLNNAGDYQLQLSSNDQGYVDYALQEALVPGDIVEMQEAGGVATARMQIGEFLAGGSPALVRVYPLRPATPSFTGAIEKITIIRSAYANNPAAVTGSIASYGEDKTAALQWAGELLRRQALADRLNDRLLADENADIQHFNLPTGWPPLEVDWSGFSDSTVKRTMDPEYGLAFYQKCESDVIRIRPRRLACNDETTIHPFIDRLNGLLNEAWAANIETTASVISSACDNISLNYNEHDPVVTNAEASFLQALTDHVVTAADACMLYQTGELVNLKAGMVPRNIAPLYTSTEATLLLKSNTSNDKQLASLSLTYNSHVLLQLYAFATNGTCDLNWGFLPDTKQNVEGQGLSFSDFSGVMPGGFNTLMEDGGDPQYFTNQLGYFGQNNQGYLYFHCRLTDKRYIFYKLHFHKDTFDSSAPISAAVQTMKRSASGPGHYAIDDDGQLVYYPSDNINPIRIQALTLSADGLERVNAGPAPTTVIAAGAVGWSDVWDYDESDYDIPAGLNPYAKGARGEWRTRDSYTFRTEIEDVESADARVYTMATFANFSFFDHANTSASVNNGWLRVNHVSAYSPNGEALQEKNILGIPSAARFGYRCMLPVLVARNAEYEAVAFTSFEDEAISLGPGQGIKDSYAHAGEHAYFMAGADVVTIATLTISSRVQSSGLLCKFWLRTHDFGRLGANFKVRLVNGSGTLNFDAPQEVARSGEWALYEAFVSGTAIAGSSLGLGAVDCELVNDVNEVYVDDIRIQPLDAEMTTYVYDDASFRLLASMDDQHFALYYQYNAEGQLIRNLRETERGVLTVQEAQYNMPKIDRNLVEAAAASNVNPHWNNKVLRGINGADVLQKAGPLRNLLQGADGGKGGQLNLQKKLELPEADSR